jgi:hypothetical protein
MPDSVWIALGAIVLIVCLLRCRRKPVRRPRRQDRPRSQGHRRTGRRVSGMADVLGWTPTRQEIRDAQE